VVAAALSRTLCTAANLGVADHIYSGTRRTASDLAKATGTHERSLYRVLRLLASHGLFRKTASGEFDHTPLSKVLRSDVGMTCFHGSETDAMLAAYDFGTVRVLADIGGGNGSLISSVLKPYPTMRGTLFDLGHVVARAQERLREQGITDRCQVIEGKPIPAG
jgi:hypothetical protein